MDSHFTVRRCKNTFCNPAMNTPTDQNNLAPDYSRDRENPLLGEMKQCKSAVIWRDFLLIVHCLGW